MATGSAGRQIAIMPCVAIAPLLVGGPATAAACPARTDYIVPDIREATRKADFVIVFPHWGVEYTRRR